MRPRLFLVAIGLASCGRVGFDDTPHLDSVTSDDGPLGCTHTFCDDFEDPGFVRWDGGFFTGGGTAVRDGSFGRSGGSMKATSPVGSSEADHYVDVFPTTQVPDQWVRVMVFAPSGQMLDFEPVVMMDGPRSQELVFSLYDTDVDIHAHGIAGAFNETRMVSTPRDRWVCYELHVQFAASGLVELYQDGAVVVQHMTSTTPNAGTALRRIVAGIASKPNALAETIRIDDVAADTTRVGCL